MEFREFESQLNQPLAEKLEAFRDSRDGRLRHLIHAAQLKTDVLECLCEGADKIRLLCRHKESADALRGLLSHRRAMLYFTQPSTRTFLSFMAACQILGITCNEVRDPSTSSEVKGESSMDSIRMFSSYFDVIIMRSPLREYAECCAYLMNSLAEKEMRFVPIVNAGSGSEEHPTQALLDLYTLRRTFAFRDREGADGRWQELQRHYPELQKGLAGKTYLFCGDMGRGRTVRSLATVLSQYDQTRMFFVTPPQSALKLDERLRNQLQESGVEVHEFESLDAQHEGQSILSQIDCLYMTRIQSEHNSDQDTNEIRSLDLTPCQLTPARVAQLKTYVPILHPFPRDQRVQEIPEEIDADPRAMYFRQARNGVWARASLLAHLFDVDSELDEIFERFRGEA